MHKMQIFASVFCIFGTYIGHEVPNKEIKTSKIAILIVLENGTD